MQTSMTSSILFSALFATTLAYSQEPPAQTSSPSVGSSSQTVAPANPQPVAAGKAACTLGSHDGIESGTALTAARILCDEIRKTGTPVVGPEVEAAGATQVYRIDLGRLDQATVLSVTLEQPAGTALRSERLVLNRVDEVVVIAPRIAASIVTGKPMAATAQVDTLAGEETRKYEKKHGEGFWDIGVVGASFPGRGVTVAPGFELGYRFETRDFSLGAGFRYARMDTDDQDAYLASLSVGARYLFSRSNISPYAGGGLAYGGLEFREKYDTPQAYDTYRRYEGSGMGAFLEGGVEFFRLHKTRLNFGVRVDAPFYSAKSEDYVWETTPATSSSSSPQMTSRFESHTAYVLPVSLNLTLGF